MAPGSVVRGRKKRSEKAKTKKIEKKVSEAVDWGGKRAADFCHCPIKQLRVIDLKVSLRMLYC